MALTRPRTLRWTLSQFLRLEELGLLPNDVRVELVDGEILEKPPMNAAHRQAVLHGTELLGELFRTTHWVSVQVPITLSQSSAPEPDFCLLPKAGFDIDRVPQIADLVIEASESSLDYDRDQKASLYAKYRVREYWVLNLVDHRLEVYRIPVQATDRAHGFHWQDVKVLSWDDTVCPLFAPDVVVSVQDLF